MSYKQFASNDNKTIFKAMINNTRNCLASKGISTSGNINDQTEFKEALKCETAYFSEGPEFTYHTHPNGSEEPSDLDRKTTSKFGKKYMFIGLVPQRKVVVYSAKDNFQKKIGSFGV